MLREVISRGEVLLFASPDFSAIFRFCSILKVAKTQLVIGCGARKPSPVTAAAAAAAATECGGRKRGYLDLQMSGEVRCES